MLTLRCIFVSADSHLQRAPTRRGRCRRRPAQIQQCRINLIENRSFTIFPIPWRSFCFFFRFPHLQRYDIYPASLTTNQSTSPGRWNRRGLAAATEANEMSNADSTKRPAEAAGSNGRSTCTTARCRTGDPTGAGPKRWRTIPRIAGNTIYEITSTGRWVINFSLFTGAPNSTAWRWRT